MCSSDFEALREAEFGNFKEARGVAASAIQLSQGGRYVRGAAALSLAITGDVAQAQKIADALDRKSTRLNSSHPSISYAVFCLKKKTDPTATLAGAPGATVRLLSGRLRAPYDAAVSVSGNVSLDDLRRVFPGY